MDELTARQFWSTEVELAFIRGLGTHAKRYFFTHPVSRVELLERYLQTTKTRVAWGNMDRERVIEYAKRQLKQAKRRSQ